MATTLTEPRRKYDPNLTIRVPATVRDALQAMARERNGTVTDVVLEHVKPFMLFASSEGQEAHARIRLAITESTAVNKGFPKQPEPFAGEWHGLTVHVLGVEWEELFERQVPTSEVHYGHIVRQREGQSRSEAIRLYADVLWKEWASAPEGERSEILAELTDPTKHVFVIAYVSFTKWRSFPGAYEANLHRAWFVEKDLPEEAENAQEASFLVNAARHLSRLWLEVNLEGGAPRPTLVLQGGNNTLPIWNEDALELFYYPQVSRHENVNTWARQLLKIWRNAPGKDAAGIIHNTTLQAEVLTIETA